MEDGMAKYEIRQEPEGRNMVWCAYDEEGRYVKGSFSQVSADDCESKLRLALIALKGGTTVVRTVEVDE
jgi:hypothetical protein